MASATFDFSGNGAGSSGAARGARLLARLALTGLALPGLVLALAACATAPAGTPHEAPYEPNASMGMLIARQSCADCHQTGRTGDSPNPRAPAFNAIVNRPGMTPDTLASWLRDGHNYPAEMGFDLEPHRVESLIAYMVRLQSGEPVS